jgi:hypothetical protein
VKTVYDYVISANKNGDYFPLWGTCLGFESIMRAQSEDPNVLSQTDAENITLALNVTALAAASRIFDPRREGASAALADLSTQVCERASFPAAPPG